MTLGQSHHTVREGDGLGSHTFSLLDFRFSGIAPVMGTDRSVWPANTVLGVCETSVNCSHSTLLRSRFGLDLDFDFDFDLDLVERPA